MNDDLRTVDSILEAIEGATSRKEVWPPGQWVEAAWSLQALIGDEHDKLIELEQKVAQITAMYIAGGDSVAFAKVSIVKHPEYTALKKQSAKIKQVEELVRIAKLRARLADSEMHQ
jgi:hypothetical protein